MENKNGDEKSQYIIQKGDKLVTIGCHPLILTICIKKRG